jgi:hypothetical protein
MGILSPLSAHPCHCKSNPIRATAAKSRQIRTRVLNDQLANDFHRWYPGFTHSTSEADTLGDQLLAA